MSCCQLDQGTEKLGKGKALRAKKDVPKTEWLWAEGQLQTRRGSEGHSRLDPSVWFPLVVLPIHSPSMPWASGSLYSAQLQQVSAERAHS